MEILRYPKKVRLSSKKDIGQLLEKGTVIFKYPFKLYVYPFLEKEGCYFAVSVPKKNFKRAVARNRIKRVTKEAIRLNRSILCNFNATFLFVYIGKEFEDFANIQKQVQELFIESLALVEKSRKTDSGISVSDADKAI